ncbi:MAG: uracil-DNA glycosylase [Alphaproteobacteria bacterium]|jgi:uracil-DNA glycosylase|nr:MAG: uracil-DNA glycosylase [Alphaproteobacteria bacterium]
MPKGSTAAPPEAPLDCPLCPRLFDFRTSIAKAHPDWFNAPVPSFGDVSARFMIVGLAPGLQGANRTGRPFTGDYAGDLLYSTLDKFGFSTGKFQARPDDGLKLKDTIITNAVRCVPPENKPTGAEIVTCRQFLIARMEQLPNVKVMLALGRIAHDSTVRALGAKPTAIVFGHARRHVLEGPHGPVVLHDSYHCSRYNTNTGRLTEKMFHDVFKGVRDDLDR